MSPENIELLKKTYSKILYINDLNENQQIHIYFQNLCLKEKDGYEFAVTAIHIFD